MTGKNDNADAALRARAGRQARADLPPDADTGTRAVYANLLWRKYALEAAPDPSHADKIKIQEIKQKIQSLIRREERKFQEKQNSPDQPREGIAVGAAAFAGAVKYTKRGGKELTRVVPRVEVDAFIAQIKEKTGKNTGFKQIFDLVAKKFGLTRENLDSEQNVHIKAAMNHLRNLEKGVSEAVRLETDIISEIEVQDFARTAGGDAEDVVGLAELARRKFGITAATLHAPRFRHVAALLVSRIAHLGITNTAEAVEYLEILL